MDYFDKILYEDVDPIEYQDLLASLESEIEGENGGRSTINGVSNNIQNVTSGSYTNKEIVPELNRYHGAVYSGGFATTDNSGVRCGSSSGLKQNRNISQFGNNLVETSNKNNNVSNSQVYHNEATSRTVLGNNKNRSMQIKITKEQFDKLVKDHNLVVKEKVTLNPLQKGTVTRSLPYNGTTNSRLNPVGPTFKQSPIISSTSFVTNNNNKTVNTALQNLNDPGTSSLYVTVNEMQKLKDIQTKRCQKCLNAILSWAKPRSLYPKAINLIQEFIDSKLDADGFCKELQRRFKIKTEVEDFSNIKLVRTALIKGDIFIEGIRPQPHYVDGSFESKNNFVRVPNIPVGTASLKKDSFVNAFHPPSFHVNRTIGGKFNSGQIQPATNVQVRFIDPRKVIVNSNQISLTTPNIPIGTALFKKDSFVHAIRPSSSHGNRTIGGKFNSGQIQPAKNVQVRSIDPRKAISKQIVLATPNIPVRTAVLRKEIPVNAFRPPSSNVNRTIGSKLNYRQILPAASVQVQSSDPNEAVVKSKNNALPRVTRKSKFRSIEKTRKLRRTFPKVIDKRSKTVFPGKISSNVKVDNITLEEQLALKTYELKLKKDNISEVSSNNQDTEVAVIGDGFNDHIAVDDDPTETEIKPCKETPFLNVESLQQKIKNKLLKYGIQEPQQEVSEIISKACEEEMRRFLTRLQTVTEHRLTLLKDCQSNLKKTSDPQAQLKFLENFERLKYERQGKIEHQKMASEVERSDTKRCNLRQSKTKAQTSKVQSLEINKNIVYKAGMLEVAATTIRTKKKFKCDGKEAQTNTWTSNNFSSLKSRFKKVTIEDLKNLCQIDQEFGSTKFVKLLFKINV